MARRKSKGSTLRDVGATTDISLGEFSTRAMREYGSFVLMDRAVSDVRDGLKPVQRRILWSLHQLKATPSSNFKKSAKIVGDCMGGYHPHGGSAIYGTLVNLVGSRYPLVEGHGNFGTPTDSPASMRYTEARLTPLAALLLEDVAVGEFVPNYSGDLLEPLVLPSRLPLLFLNGSSGIGVGVRAVVPPHNLRELTKVLVYLLRKPNPRMSTALKHLHGPDYGYGVLLSGADELEALYTTGTGTLRYRCEYDYETTKNGNVLVVKSLAPGFSMSTFLTKMQGLQADGLIVSCVNASTDVINIHIEFTDRTVIKDRVLPDLYTTQSYQFYAVKRNDESSLSAETLFCSGLFPLLRQFLDFRREVEKARLDRELRVEKAKLHRVKAILAALSNLDLVYGVLKKVHPDMDTMRKEMASALSITDKQANVILEMKVHRLSRMNIESQEKVKSVIREEILSIKKDLTDIDGVVFLSLKALLKFADDRGTRVVTRDDAPPIPGSVQPKYVIVQGTKALRLDKAPTRRHKFDLLGYDSSSLLFVYRDNSVSRFSLSYSVEESLPSVPVGLVSGSSLAVCALDDRGLLSIVTPPAKSPFNVMRGATSLLSAVGVIDGDTLVVATEAGVCKTIPPSLIRPARSFSAGKKPFPKNSAWKRLVPFSLFAVNPATRLYSSTGRCVAPRSGDEYASKSVGFESAGGLYSIGKTNFVSLLSEDKRDIVSRKDAVNLLKNGNLNQCWPLAVD